MDKKRVVDFLKQRYIKHSQISYWRTCTLGLWGIFMLAFFRICDPYIATYNVNPLLYLLMIILVMRLSFKKFFSISNKLQVQHKEIWDKKISDMRTAVNMDKEKNGKKVIAHKVKIAGAILGTVLVFMQIKSYSFLVAVGVKPIWAFLFFIGVSILLIKATDLLFLWSDYNYLVKEK